METTVARAQRIPQNAKGKFYVTVECNGCGFCYSFAPESIDFTSDGKLYFVFKQPGTEAEVDHLREAIEMCPLECMRDNGDEFDG